MRSKSNYVRWIGAHAVMSYIINLNPYCIAVKRGHTFSAMLLLSVTKLSISWYDYVYVQYKHDKAYWNGNNEFFHSYDFTFILQ